LLPLVLKILVIFEILQMFLGCGQKRNINIVKYFLANAQERDMIK
jgi:hypothetical protein